jgi:hypothetical protein
MLRGLERAGPLVVHRRLRAAVALWQQQEIRVAPLLLRIFEGRLYRDPDSGAYARFEDYAVERLGVSARRARMLLRVARAVRRSPELDSAWRSGKLAWLKTHELVPLVSLGECRELPAWIAWARRVTVRRLRDDVARAVDLAATDPVSWCATGGLPAEARVGEAGRAPEPAERQTGAESSAAATTPFFFSAPVVVARLFRATPCRVRRALEASEDEALRFMFEHFLAVWDEARVPSRYRVFARDGWRCTVPGCTSYRNLHDHHVVYRRQGGSDELSNRTTLCAWHHLHGEHEHRIRITGTAPDRLVFELGLRPGRRPLAVYDAVERAVR